jgi:hypothetical protein
LRALFCLQSQLQGIGKGALLTLHFSLGEQQAGRRASVQLGQFACFMCGIRHVTNGLLLPTAAGVKPKAHFSVSAGWAKA